MYAWSYHTIYLTLNNHKDLGGWVSRGMGRVHNVDPDSDLERSEFIIISSQILVSQHTCVSGASSGTTQPLGVFASEILKGIRI